MSHAPSSGTEDAALVAAVRGGDPASWGAIFDRHRDAVWRLGFGIVRRRNDADDVVQATFLKAVESLDQLRDPAALRPWLLAIANRRALDLVRRGREVAHDPGEETWPDQPQPHPDDPLTAGLRQEELARLVSAAFDGLEPRDRAALELAERQGLSGDELAVSLDVTRDNAYQLLHNARDRFEASVSSLVVARTGRADCADLDSLLEGWDGTLTPLLRKRLARHTKRCATCGETRRVQVSPAALLALLPVVAMSTLAADQGRAAALAATGSSGDAASTAVSAASSGGGAAVGAKVAAVAAVGALLAGGVLVAVSVASGGDGGDNTLAVGSEGEPATDDQPAPTAEPTTTAPATTATEPEEFCTILAELTDAAAGGPTSGDPADLFAYLVLVDAHLQRLVAASSPATPELAAYASAYGDLVAGGVDAARDTADDPELNALRETVEAQLADACRDTSS